MIYFDTAYIVKCYVHEPGSAEVRQLLHGNQTIACCALGRIEFATSILRAVRERRLDARAIETVFAILDEDNQGGIWTWLPLSPSIVDSTLQTLQGLSASVVVRAGDAIHLACAKEHGFREIYTNDRHMIAAAPHFGLKAVNIIQ